jgi:hypothetical protein
MGIFRSISSVVRSAYSSFVFSAIFLCVLMEVALLCGWGCWGLGERFLDLTFAILIFVFFIGNSMDHAAIKLRSVAGAKGRVKPEEPKLARYLKISEERLKYDRPKVVLYASGIKNVGYQTNMWLPVLERLRVPVGIIIRDLHIYKELNEVAPK